jgi:hypothetical protein
MSVTMDFTFYISTTPSDYYLTKALVSSIQHYCPYSHIYILPDDFCDKRELFGCPIWRPEDPYVLALDGYYKKLRIFWGPAKSFVYLDADMLVLKDLKPLTTYIALQNQPFLMTCLESKFLPLWCKGGEIARKEIFKNTVGQLQLILDFDPKYKWEARIPFHSGFIAASHDYINHKDLLDTFFATKLYHEKREKNKFTTSRTGIFMSDQGFINYYLAKYELAVEYIKDIVIWGGNKIYWAESIHLTDSLSGLFVHWAGCPRPGIIPRSVPGQSEWTHEYLKQCKTPNDYLGLINDFKDDIYRLCKNTCSRFK